MFRHAVGAIAGHATWLSELSTLVRLPIKVDIEISKNIGHFTLFVSDPRYAIFFCFRRTVSDPRCTELQRELPVAL